MTTIHENCECLHCLSRRARVVERAEWAARRRENEAAQALEVRKERNWRAVAVFVAFLACWAIVAFNPVIG